MSIKTTRAVTGTVSTDGGGAVSGGGEPMETEDRPPGRMVLRVKLLKGGREETIEVWCVCVCVFTSYI